jgi:hypothetical protein
VDLDGHGAAAVARPSLGAAAALLGADVDGDGRHDLPLLAAPQPPAEAELAVADPETLTFELSVGDGTRTSVPDSTDVTVTPCADCLEADVAPRPDGNGAVTAADFALASRFALALDEALPGSEFQRADAAPAATLGDGSLTVADWVQAGRYAAALDPPAPAGGPSVASFAPRLRAAAPGEAARTVRAENAVVASDGTAEVAVALDGRGDESALGFSLSFDARDLELVEVTPGPGAEGATLVVNPGLAADGMVGVGLAMPPGRTLPADRGPLLRARFRPTAAWSGAVTAVGVGDLPVRREVVDAAAGGLEASFAGASVSAAPLAGEARAGGRSRRGRERAR